MRALLPIVFAVIAAACAGPAASPTAPSLTPAAPASPTSPTTPPLSVQLSDFKIEPSQIDAPAGTVVLSVTSSGPTPHNLTVRDQADAVVFASVDLSAGESDVVEGTLAPGEYELFCSFAGHESLGMRASLTVTE